MNISANFQPKSDYIVTIYTNLSTVNTYVAHNAEKSWLYLYSILFTYYMYLHNAIHNAIFMKEVSPMYIE